MQTYTFDPTFIVDITDTFDLKMKAVNCYSTQFHNPKSKEPETFISSPEFFNYIKSRAEFYGFSIGKNYGEPFFCEEKIELDLVHYLTNN
jgi:LmbE family N-acetylglucosaminyl deacetylase